MHEELCICGSGKPFERCHGDSENEYARLQALAEARQIALLFPGVRLLAPAVLELVETAARELGDVEEPPERTLDAIAEAVDDAEAKRLVDAWTSVYPDRWESLVRAAADGRAAERELLKGAVSVAIHERLPTPRERLVQLELVQPAPAPSLAFLVPPQLVWSYDEARAAAAASPWQREEVAAALGRIEHVERVRGIATLLRRELPFAELPRTTAAVAEACATVAGDLAFARRVASLCLDAYVAELSYITSPN